MKLSDVAKARSAPAATISPARVRYIKLGEGGRWEKTCLDRGLLRIGFGTGSPVRFRQCVAGRWKDLTAHFVARGKDKGTATRFTNEVRHFFEDDGSTLWITFVGERLCWAFLDSRPADIYPDLEGACRTVNGRWRWTDIAGEPLTKDRLSGALTKLAGFRGTSCTVDKADYAIRRINAQKIPEVERALVVSAEMKAAVLDLMRLLEPRDFELLVDLVFTTSGWRRVGVLGKTQKTLDLDLVLPSTGERSFVQVKSHTTSAELAQYVAKLDEMGPYDRMFFVFHSGDAATKDKRVKVIGPSQLAEMVMDAGLASWLIRKVS
jgi:hypothetical protein